VLQVVKLRRSLVSLSLRVAIAGVTGYIGGRLAPRLIEHGCAIRCLVRSPAKLQSRPWATDPEVVIRQASLEDEDSLSRDLQGCEAAFYLVHSMMSSGSDYAEHDRQLASTFARAAVRPRTPHNRQTIGYSKPTELLQPCTNSPVSYKNAAGVRTLRYRNLEDLRSDKLEGCFSATGRRGKSVKITAK